MMSSPDLHCTIHSFLEAESAGSNFLFSKDRIPWVWSFSLLSSNPLLTVACYDRSVALWLYVSLLLSSLTTIENWLCFLRNTDLRLGSLIHLDSLVSVHSRYPYLDSSLFYFVYMIARKGFVLVSPLSDSFRADCESQLVASSAIARLDSNVDVNVGQN